jgi:hypothetical protein
LKIFNFLSAGFRLWASEQLNTGPQLFENRLGAMSMARAGIH